DQARKQTLVDYGFRLKAAKDNRPLKFEEFNQRMNQTIYVSATPAEYELKLSKQTRNKLTAHRSLLKAYSGIAEQIVRPTGLVDPTVDIRPTEEDKFENLKSEIQRDGLKEFTISQKITGNQIDDLIGEIKKTVGKGQRVLVTTLTKRMAEDLTIFLKEIGTKVQYIHSDVDTIQRVEILRDLRIGKYDVLVGINLLREGLDLPEVSLVAILDADKEGFLRSDFALIQVSGRASRHSEGRVIMYADKITGSMKRAILETQRRRVIQEKYNKKHNITPKTIEKDIADLLTRETDEEGKKGDITGDSLKKQAEGYPAMKAKEKKDFREELEVQMNIYADMLEFEKAAEMRDLLKGL
ncbi:MAG TPA: hypothetical protein ENI23_14950, partial [bacterium]|nr:hypothetical protein [bacterium]